MVAGFQVVPPCEISCGAGKNRPKLDHTGRPPKFFGELRVCRWYHLKVAQPVTEISPKTRSRDKKRAKIEPRQILEHRDYASRQFVGCATLKVFTYKMIARRGPVQIAKSGDRFSRRRNFSEISCGTKNIGQTGPLKLTAEIFLRGRRFAGGATLS